MGIKLFLFAGVLTCCAVSVINYTTDRTKKCPCSFDSSTLAADCSCPECKQGEMLQSIPDRDCVPDIARKLDLSGNNITYQPGQLHRFQNLTNLTLSNNNFFTPDNDSFTGLTHLQVLFLDGTYLRNVQTGLFTAQTNLELLSLQGAVLKYLPDVLLTCLHNLIELDLSWNSLIDIGNAPFKSLSNIQHLDLSGNWNIMLNNQSLTGLTHLQTINLSDCRLYTLPDGLFTELQSLTYLVLSLNYFADIGNTPIKSLSNLQPLNLQGNQNIMLNNQTFTGLTNLETLDLSHRALQSLPDGLFNDLHKLAYLYLSENSLTVLGDTLFKPLSNLKHLDLHLNKHIMLKNEAITGLINLEKILLSKCNLHSLPDGLFANFHNLTYLDLSWNFLTDIGNTTFKPLSNLQHLYLQENWNIKLNNQTFIGLTNLQTLDLHKCNLLSLPHGLFTDLHSLTSLDLSHNTLYDMGNTQFKSLPNLQRLYLQFNDYIMLHYRIFSALKELRHLDLSSCEIKKLPDDIFVSQHKLQYLSLAQNVLPQISFDINSKSLATLDLRESNVQYISPKVTKEIEAIAEHTNLTLYLYGNSLLCDCDHIEFVSWLGKTRVIGQMGKLQCEFDNGKRLSLTRAGEMFAYLEDNCGSLTCECDSKAFDAWAYGTHIKFRERDFACNYLNGTTVDLRLNPKLVSIVRQKCIAVVVLWSCVAGTAFQTVAIGFAVYVWFRRWKFRYLLAIGRRNTNPYHPIEDCNIDLEYDVYISYERDSELPNNITLHELVTRTIYPELQRRGLKVLIREEFDPGSGLYNVITSSIRRCQKVIALISKDYCKDFWNVFEFHTAVLEGIYTKRQIMVPIAVDPIEPRDLHGDVNAFLRSRPVPYYTPKLPDRNFIEFLFNRIRDVSDGVD